VILPLTYKEGSKANLLSDSSSMMKSMSSDGGQAVEKKLTLGLKVAPNTLVEFILRDHEFGQDLPSPRMDSQQQKEVKTYKKEFRIYLAKHEFQGGKNRKPSLKSQKIPLENIKWSTKEQIKERLKMNINIEAMYKEIKGKVMLTAFQPEVNDRLELTHIAISRNPYDMGEIFQKISKMYERYYRKLVKRFGKP